jgi:chemotaxis receptor (MCP) glutamine deamidase CheD
MAARSTRPTVGKLNCEVALNVLNEEGFQVVASSLGGNCGVNIHFNTKTREVLLRRHS